MDRVILRANAIPVYSFLSLINTLRSQGKTSQGYKILDCGAGGPIPPLALFSQHGFETWGIDISEEQLDRARQFCEQQDIEIDLRSGDMRNMPFADETFDYVYEHYSLCHLSKQDTAQAVGEVYRVLKPEGLCFLGVISTDSWPKSMFGEEESPGEYWGEEGGEPRSHSVFSDEEADDLVSAWEVVIKEKHVRYLDSDDKPTMEEWMGYYDEAGGRYSREAWQARYANKAGESCYAHLYYYLKKP